MPGKRRRFTNEFEAEIVKLVVNGGRSVPDVCREHKLGETAVYKWVKQAFAANVELEGCSGDVTAGALLVLQPPSPARRVPWLG